MKLLNACSYGEWTASTLTENSGDSRIESVYSGAVNWIDDQGRLLCVSDSHGGNIPFGITAEIPPGFSFSDCGVRPGDPVKNELDSLIIGNQAVAVNLETASLAGPENIGLKSPVALTLDNLQQAADMLLGQIQESEGLGVLLRGLPDLFSADPSFTGSKDPFINQAGHVVCELICAIRKKTTAGVLSAAEQLVGLGHGATPSGDDFLVGLLAAWQHTGDQDFVSAFARGLEPRIARTTRLSQAFLLHACAGRFAKRVNVFLSAVCRAKVEEIVPAARWLTEFGASSGVDTGAGIVIGLGCMAEEAGIGLWELS